MADPSRSRSALRGPPLWRRWTLAVSAGEAAGFVFPAAVGALVWDQPAAVESACLLAAGACEGAVLGFSQATVLRRALPALSARAWIGATTAGAVAAYAISMLPVLAGDAFADLGAWARAAIAVPLGLALVCSIGFFQWRVLREHVSRAVVWIVATAGAWVAGLLALVSVSTPLWREGQAVGLTIAIGILGGAVMAVVVAALTGLALVRLLEPGDPPARPPVP